MGYRASFWELRALSLRLAPLCFSNRLLYFVMEIVTKLINQLPHQLWLPPHMYIKDFMLFQFILKYMWERGAKKLVRQLVV